MHAKHAMIPKAQVTTIPSQFSLAKTLSIMERVGHRTLPVVDYGRFVGVVDKLSIYEHTYIQKDIDLEKATVADVMIKNVPHIEEEDLIENAAVMIKGQRIFFLPVVKDHTEDQFVGIIPNSMILNIFMAGFGYGEEGHRLSVVVQDMKGQLARLTRIITAQDCDIISLVTISPSVDLGLVRVVIKFKGNPDTLAHRLEESGYRILDLDKEPYKSHMERHQN